MLRSQKRGCRREFQASDSNICGRRPPLQLANASWRRKAGAMNEMAKIENAVSAGTLLESSATNIRRVLESASSPVVSQSIAELVEAGEWTELNDRFFRSLAFGTGGIRGRTIGRIVTAAERSTPNELGRPEFPCVG